MRTWKIIHFGGGATMLVGFPFTFIFLMRIVPRIKCWIWIEHISQTTHWILMKFGQRIHNIMKNKYVSFSSIQCMFFEKMTIITYNQFAFFLKYLMWVSLIFGVEMHWTNKNLLQNFQPNPTCSLWEIGRKVVETIADTYL